MPTPLKAALDARLKRAEVTIRQEVYRELDLIGQEYRLKFQRIVASWRGKPQFTYTVKVIGDGKLRLQLKTSGQHAQKWQWVDQGTKRHIIKPKRPGGRLTFRTGYSPKTQPIARFNAGSGRSNGIWRSTKIVRHPGVRPRLFTRKFSETLKPTLPIRIKNAALRGLRRA